MLPMGIVSSGALFSAGILKFGHMSSPLHILSLFALAGAVIVVTSFVASRLFRYALLRG